MSERCRPEAGSRVPAGACSAAANTSGPSDRELTEAFHEAYRRIGLTAGDVRDASAMVYGLAELLVRNGVVGLDELERTRQTVEERMDAALEQVGMTVQLTDQASDKYALEETATAIDCENRLHVCFAACCRLRFALSEQDITEGVLCWELAEPYLNRQTDDGWCVHNDASTGACNVYTQRPTVCRQYDCRQDPRIWVDFDARIINPDLANRAVPGSTLHTAIVPDGARRLPLRSRE